MSEFGQGAAPVQGPATGAPVFNETTSGTVRDDATGADSIQDDSFEEASSAEKKLLTQEEHERSLKRRLARQERKLREELQQQAQEEARKARMDETERLRVERDEALNTAKAQVAEANRQVMHAKAEALAASMGVSEAALKYIAPLVEQHEVDLDDPESIRDAVSQVLNDVPALAHRADVGSQETAQASAGQSPVMPMGRDRAPATSAAAGGAGSASALDLFNRRLRQRTSER